MGQLIQFAAPAPDPKPAAKRTVIRLLTPTQVAQSIREKLEHTVETFADHERRAAGSNWVPCTCRTCETYRRVLLHPAVQRSFLELFDGP